jgi:hypothetical protein
MRSREARNVIPRLAELSVHGANAAKGQIVLVQAEIGLEEQARATAEAAYKRGAKFVDVTYFDPYLKLVRIESADPDTLSGVDGCSLHAARAGRRDPHRVARAGEHPTWGELLGSLVVLVGLGLALGVVDALAVPRRTAARVPAPTRTPTPTPTPRK